ncbi:MULTISPECIES: oxidoreductase [unclassified Brevundimonas]|uniref:oxidoreductase n=1 Tax=unclassified Brevundimonas TaxID=2622653 RepID=UPI0025C5D744|nr:MULTISPECIES: oxidoreductase [unclassified Brevundimonas]
MRFRPLGDAGTAVSSITLTLDAGVAATGAENIRALVYAALEEGVNSFHIDSLDGTLIRTFGDALSDIDRDLLHITLTLGPLPNGRRDFSVDGVNAVMDAVLNATGINYFDAVVLDDPAESELPVQTLKTLRADERIMRLGIRGNSDVMDIYISSGRFDLLFTPCHIQLDQRQRAWMRSAKEQQLIVFGTEYYPEELLNPAKPPPPPEPTKGLFGLSRKKVVVEEPLSPFAFLHTTAGWEAEDLCLAHALLDPSLGSVVVRASDVENLRRLARACERDMPVSMPAQLEMARVIASRAA